jgi:anti-sigma factor RsiW
MPEPQCLEDHELLPLLDGGKAPKKVADHLQACAACRRRLERLRAEVQSLRRNTASP